MLIGNNLKRLRESKKLTVEQVTEHLSISSSSYRKYEYNEREPSTDIVIEIADFYGVTTDYLLGREPEKNPIAMLNLAVGEKEALEMYVKLPEEVRQIIIDTMIQLGEAAKNARDSEDEVPEAEWEIRCSEYKVSAGTGVQLGDRDQWNSINVPDTPEAHKANFALKIKGNSMEPVYFDGDIVLVKEQPAIDIGQIGIFTIEGEGYIKKYGGDRLISLNAEYDDIIFAEHDEERIRCVGRVIGRA